MGRVSEDIGPPLLMGTAMDVVMLEALSRQSVSSVVDNQRNDGKIGNQK